jgi:hypothetical protein
MTLVLIACVISGWTIGRAVCKFLGVAALA